MPREKLRSEIERIEAMGVEIKLDTRIDDIIATREQGDFDAVFLCIGAQRARSIEIPADGEVEMLDALTILRDTELENPTRLKGRVLVYGGGNTAMDVARSAVRLGARQTTVVVLESREQMPAHAFEVHEALEEGAELLNLRSIKQISGSTVTLEVMVAGEGRWPQPTGQIETVEADVVVQALGQDIDTGLVQSIDGIGVNNGIVEVGLDLQTGADGVFAGGDMVPSARTVTTSIGHGKKAARSIDAYLRGKAFALPEKHEIVDFGKLNTWYYSDAPRTLRPMLDVVRRSSGFAEVVGDLDEDNALYEARRCLSCGNCFECDNCYGVCPDNAITKLGPGNRFEFKYDYCKGCALCATECPCGAIKMVPEDI
ncbi:MAG: FAD-dependent oxidoreductase [Gammaproteobacteria bacterium]|nr:FAD-dependent oxidoreductase [Gammaproteobacteria bacterium]